MNNLKTYLWFSMYYLPTIINCQITIDYIEVNFAFSLYEFIFQLAC